MKPLLKIIIISLISISFINPCNANEIQKKTSMFVESLEWDPIAHSKVEKYKQHESTYLNYIQAKDEKQIYLGSIMLGLLESKSAIELLKKIKPKTQSSKVGVLFSLCALKQNYSENYSKLEVLGKKTQDVAGAKSIVNLDVVELLSFLGDPKFKKYASSLKSDEQFQNEAISVAITRYEAIAKNGF